MESLAPPSENSKGHSTTAPNPAVLTVAADLRTIPEPSVAALSGVNQDVQWGEVHGAHCYRLQLGVSGMLGYTWSDVSAPLPCSDSAVLAKYPGSVIPPGLHFKCAATLTGLAPASAYAFRVQACNLRGGGAGAAVSVDAGRWSAPFQFTSRSIQKEAALASAEAGAARAAVAAVVRSMQDSVHSLRAALPTPANTTTATPEEITGAPETLDFVKVCAVGESLQHYIASALAALGASRNREEELESGIAALRLASSTTEQRCKDLEVELQGLRQATDLTTAVEQATARSAAMAQVRLTEELQAARATASVASAELALLRNELDKARTAIAASVSENAATKDTVASLRAELATAVHAKAQAEATAAEATDRLRTIEVTAEAASAAANERAAQLSASLAQLESTTALAQRAPLEDPAVPRLEQELAEARAECVSLRARLAAAPPVSNGNLAPLAPVPGDPLAQQQLIAQLTARVAALQEVTRVSRVQLFDANELIAGLREHLDATRAQQPGQPPLPQVPQLTAAQRAVVVQLMGMGFSAAQSELAAKSGDSFDAALNFVMSETSASRASSI